MKPHVIFSYPRSGNTWLRYIFECITGYPSLGTPDNLENDPPIYQRRKNIPVNPLNPPRLFKRHKFDQFNEQDLNSALIIVVRNYKECIVRHKPDVLHDTSLLESQFRYYLGPLAIYHKHVQPKHLIYYEDLIQSAEKVIIEFGNFMNAPIGRVNDFLEKYDEHRLNSVRQYEGGSQTQGNGTVFHQKRLSETERFTWDEEMKKMAPEIFTTYLSHYRST